MFKIASDERIGNYIDALISEKYSIRNDFCRDYLKYIDEKITPKNVRKISNRLSQIIYGQKKIQTHDLLAISQLLGVSCEGILSAGESIQKVYNRPTNYDIAASCKKSEWNKQLNSNPESFFINDEYGKTLLDYAFENKNYKLIKFLTEKNYIHLDNKIQYYNYNGIMNDLCIDHNFKDLYRTMIGNFYADQNCAYRQKMISMAIERNDFKMITELRSRETLSMHQIDFQIPPDFDDYISLDMCRQIACTNNKEIIDYFSEEFIIYGNNKLKNHDKIFARIIFPGLDRVAEQMIAHSKFKYIDKLLGIILEYNTKVENEIMSFLNEYIVKDYYFNSTDPEMRIDSLLRSIWFNKEKNAVSYNFYDDKKELNVICMNLFRINVKSKNKKFNSTITQINEIYDRVINIKNEVTVLGDLP